MRISYYTLNMKYILLAMTIFFMACNNTNTTAPVNDCVQTSDTTAVCGDTHFVVY